MSPDAAVRDALPRVFGTFFGRFPHLTDIQLRAAPTILSGADVLLCAPTGTGKTEAYVAPVVERLMGEPAAPLRSLIVSPTRALANDLRRRLAPAFGTLGLNFGRYTGEHKDRLAGQLPDVVVTTPEGLDSLLARRPRLLGRVRAVALDEIHVVDGTPRGDQLRILVHRLEGVAERPPQRIAASATVADAPALAARYLRAAEVLESPGARRIRARAFEGRSPEDFARHLDALAARGLRKILVFCNRRVDVETLASDLRGATRFGGAIFPHHASLSQARRESAERRFLEAPAAVALATLTLELGIDIGSVDYVLLNGPPPSVASLLQRVGRGGRRSAGATRAGYAFEGEAERQRFRALLRRAGAGDLCADATDFRPGVLVQQAIVLAGGRGTVTAEELSAVIPPAIRSSLPKDVAARILEEMVDRALLEPPLAGRHVLGEKTERDYEMGRVHGNIEAERMVQVIDRLTGDLMGEISPRERRDPTKIRLGGRVHRPVAEVDGRLLTDAGRGEGAARFRSRSGPKLGFAFARAFAEELGAAPGELIEGRLGTGTVLLHGLGALGGVLLGALIKERDGGGAVLAASAMRLELGGPLGALPRPSEADVRRYVRDNEISLARTLSMGPHHRHLPTDLRVRAVARASPLGAVAAFLRDAEVRQRPPTEELPLWWAML